MRQCASLCRAFWSPRCFRPVHLSVGNSWFRQRSLAAFPEPDICYGDVRRPLCTFLLKLDTLSADLGHLACRGVGTRNEEKIWSPYDPHDFASGPRKS